MLISDLSSDVCSSELRGDDLEIDVGLQTDAAELLDVADASDADDQRRDHDRHDDHLDQADEDLPGRRQDVGDQPFARFGRNAMQHTADDDAECQRDENLPGETETGHAHRGLPCVDQRSEEHTSELQSLMRISYAVFCLKKKINKNNRSITHIYKSRTN